MTDVFSRCGRVFVALATFAVTGFALAGPEIQHWTASTGTRVYFVESHALPLVDVQVSFVAGSARDPEGAAGVASLTRALLDTGTDGLDEQQIAERIADTGAIVGGGTGPDMASLSLRTLSSAAERDAAIGIASRLLAKPAFPAEVLERERARAIAGLRDALTRPDTIADRTFTHSIYPEHPYGRLVTVESLQRITRDQLVAFHRAHYTALAASVAIVGDVTREEAERIATRLTEGLPKGDPPSELAPPSMPERHTELIVHPSAQAHIVMGMPGISRDDPDYFPLVVGNYVLGGGGFVSRLMTEVREKRGFAYSVYSGFQPQRVAGPFEIGLQTRGDQANEAKAVTQNVLREFVTGGPTADELQAAKDNFINGFGLRLDSNRKILDYVAMIGFYRLPLDWLDTYPQRVAEVTVEAVRDAFGRRIRPEHLVTVVVGGNGGGTAQPAPQATR